MLRSLEISNYRSILKARIDFQPFTILVGANGSGKTNLLRLLTDLSGPQPRLAKHYAHMSEGSLVVAASDAASARFTDHEVRGLRPRELSSPRIFSIDARLVGAFETLVPEPEVQPNGQGSVQVLDSLKTGDREDLFNTVEARLREFIPEIEKLSFAPGGNAKGLQVREAGIPIPVPVSALSEGTRLVLTILTIVYQERKPSIICLEDLDRGLHPMLFGKVVSVCQALVMAPDAPQIIATTHNPYLVDQFIDEEDSVVLVEKVNAGTTFTSLRTRLEGLDRGSETLGGAWYSGLVGGTPALPIKHLPKAAPPKAG